MRALVRPATRRRLEDPRSLPRRPIDGFALGASAAFDDAGAAVLAVNTLHLASLLTNCHSRGGGTAGRDGDSQLATL